MAGGHCLLVASALLLSFECSHAAELRGGPVGDHADAFHNYMQFHSRGYQRGSDEYHQRLALFIQRRSEMEAQNSRRGRLWTAGINALSDRTEAELAELRGGGGVAPATGSDASGLLQRLGSSAFLSQRARGKSLPQEFMDWTKLRSARSVDQGGCGSCWAVTSSEVLQMHMEIHNPNASRTFSAQELLSCVPNPHKCGGDGGCSGATVELAYHWTLSQGLAQESDTPYKAQNTQCKKTSGSELVELSERESAEDVTAVGLHKAPPGSPAAAFGMVGFERLVTNGYAALLEAVVEHGPVAISV
eukprot:CAMPEP_0171209144 /NCGR_PEP_ID=MMETSP0790-20130122/28446_1 /TAXON_ID=2925 /ORGANISM="Alexandrium catenella, Strain OF101" /LENGTH=302 /DNA_ID=CAMNT_0011674749 /DNA_START=77 /DNA_END=983 /DNA_ORIENTATION=-